MPKSQEILKIKKQSIPELKDRKNGCGNIDTSVNETLLSMNGKTVMGNKPVALFLLDKNGVIILLEGSGLDELNLNKYELVGGHIQEDFSDGPLILKLISKAVKKREKTAVCELSNKTYEIFLTYTYKNRDELTGILIVVIEAVPSYNRTHELMKDTGFQHLFEKSPDAIVILDCEDNIINSNSSFSQLFGYEKQEITGKNIFKLILPEHLNFEIQKINNSITKGEIVQFDTERTKCNGENIAVLLQAYSIEINGEKAGAYHIYRDITKRKQSEESIKNALLEKETLLKEVHHRVKNNLQIVSSLLFLQTKSLKNKETIDILLESQNRIRSIALIHEKLYQSTNLSRIDFDRYLNTLIPHLFQSFGKTNGDICYKIKAGNIFLNTDTAIPCGLIINEIVTNSLKYAFNNKQKGEINIELIYLNNNNVTLIAGDNGMGLPEEIDLNNPKSLGLQIITLLVKQLNGTMELKRNNGTGYKITFPFIEYKRVN